MAIAIKWLDLLNWELVVGGIGGVAWGTLLAVSYRWNRKRKADQRHLVRPAGPAPAADLRLRPAHASAGAAAPAGRPRRR